jgi:cell division protein FtsZ
MMISINHEEKMTQFVTIDRSPKSNATLKIVGVGGGGCNALSSMINRGLNGVEYIAINTDAQVLENNNANHKIAVGSKITKGLGAGADPTIGRKAIEEDRDRIAEILRGSDMVFLTAGMGGGTGTGGLPAVASIAKSLDILTVAIVTKPFRWEGKLRMSNAEKGIQELKQYVDSLIVIPNERLLSVIDKNANMFQALDKANEVLYEATRGIADIINVEGYINVDFADVRSVMQGSGIALMGCGIASGENRAIEAAQKAISSPFLEGIHIKGAKSVLVNVTGSTSLTMKEIYDGNNVIFEAAGEESNVIFGCVQKESMNDYVSYTVIATGFDDKAMAGARQKTAAPASAPKQVAAPAPRQQMSFNIKPYDLTDKDKQDIDVPAVYRLNTPQAKLNFEEQAPEAEETPVLDNFNFNKFKSASIEQTKNEEITKKTSSEDESSAFLRMIMD